MRQGLGSVTRGLTRAASCATIIILIVVGCAERLADDCYWTSTCVETTGGAAGSNAGLGGVTSDGGTSAGGTIGSGGTAPETGGDIGTTSGGVGTAGAPPCNGACVGSTPVCDELNGRCVGCVAPTDCPAQAPVCKPATNTCVGCLASADCAKPNPACDTATNTCVECMAASDCSGTTPFCDPSAHLCVACLEQAHCTDAKASNCAPTTHTCRPCTSSSQCSQIPGKPLCLSGSCVECTAQADCTSATTSQCDAATHTCKACTTDAHCSSIAGKNVCLNGTCVQCTATKSTACGTDTQTGTPFVCDSLKHTCTTSLAKSADLCQPCVADAQCVAGELCVLDTVGAGTSAKAVGYFCHWKKGDTVNGAPADCFANGRPYAATVTGMLSIDRQTADVCVLALSSCPASTDFRKKNCAPTGTPDDLQCGVAAPVDAKCIQVTSSSAYRCTMTCGSDEDCPNGFPCNMARGVCQF